MGRILDLLKSSWNEAKSTAKAFTISLTPFRCVFCRLGSSAKDATKAKYSTMPGNSRFVQYFNIGFPDAPDMINVLTHWAARRETFEKNGE